MTYIVAQCSTRNWSLCQRIFLALVMSTWAAGGDRYPARQARAILTSVNSCWAAFLMSEKRNVNDFQVRLDDFGLSKITVKDNGDGVASSLVPAMVQPHTTNKICEVKFPPYVQLCTALHWALLMKCVSSSQISKSSPHLAFAGRPWPHFVLSPGK